MLHHSNISITFGPNDNNMTPSKEKELNTQDHIDQIKESINRDGLDPGKIARSLKIAPSKRAILQLPKELLLKHNALIFHKGSSLSSTQRKMIVERVAYGINRGTITTEEMAKEINKLNALIRGELIKETIPKK